jgi:hypothetical protein
MTDAKLKVTFIDIDVHSDGDPIGRGEIYWSLNVDGRVVTSRSPANPLIMGSNGTIALGASATVTKSGAVGTKLVVSGSVSEQDNDDKDEKDVFTDTFTSGDGWGTGLVQHKPLSARNLNVTLNYIIERV